MREQYLPSNRPRACELFVPRVKESRLCSVCGFTLIDHEVEPVHYQIPAAQPSPQYSTASLGLGGLQHSRSADTSKSASGSITKNHFFDDDFHSLSHSALAIPGCMIQSSTATTTPSPVYMTAHNSFRSLDTHLTPSFNSAFSEYKRSPSRDSIAISDVSASPVSFKSSRPYSHYDTVPSHTIPTSSSAAKLELIKASNTAILKPKPLPMPRPYLKQQLSLAPTMEDDREDDEPEIPQRSPGMFKRIRHKRKDRSASAHAERQAIADALSSTASGHDHPGHLADYAPNNPRNGQGQQQEAVVRPQNFKELLSRFQSAADDTPVANTTLPASSFQRHYSVRLPSTAQQNRRFTLGGEALHIDTKPYGGSLKPASATSSPSPMAQLQPPPIVKLRASTVPVNYSGSPYSEMDAPSKATVLQVPLREKQLERRQSDAYQAAIKARRTGLIGSYIETKAKENLHISSDDEEEPLTTQNLQYSNRRQFHRSSPVEEKYHHQVVPSRNGKVNTPTVTVTTQEVPISSSPAVAAVPPPPIKKRQSKMAKNSNSEALSVAKPKPPNRSTTGTSNHEVQRKLSTHSQRSTHSMASPNMKIIDENSNEKSKSFQLHNESRPHTAECLSGGSDSGYPRGRWSQANSAETSSLESPRSPSQLLRSPNPHRVKASEDLYSQMTVQHTNTLAFLVDNFSDIARVHGEFSEFGRDLFNEVSVDTLVFKSNTPLLAKEKLVLFDALFVAPNYQEHKVTVMLAPTCQYAPLSIRFVERSGFGPTVLAEIEEPELSLRHLLDQAGIEPSQRSSIYRLVIMPPLSLCSFHSLAAHNMHKAMNVQRYEHHVCFIMLQLLCALKVLQSDGVEHLSNNFKEFLLTYRAIDLKTSLEDLHHLPKLMLLRETMEEDYDDFQASSLSSPDAPRVGVCRYALRALCTLLNHKMHNAVPQILERTEYSRPLRRCAELLHLDKSSSLTEAKNLLEFTFFCGRVSFDSEIDAKLFLDERRAHEVNRAVRLLADRAESLSEPRERMYVQFLLSATPRTLFQTYRQFNQC